MADICYYHITITLLSHYYHITIILYHIILLAYFYHTTIMLASLWDNMPFFYTKKKVLALDSRSVGWPWDQILSCALELLYPPVSSTMACWKILGSMEVLIGKPQENHRKAIIGKPQENGGLWDFNGIIYFYGPCLPAMFDDTRGQTHGTSW